MAKPLRAVEIQPPRRRHNLPPTPPSEGRQLLTVYETAYVLGVSPTHVWKLLRVGALPRTHVGRNTRIAQKAIDTFIAAGGTPVGMTRKT
jgi:excisionase family DNA binding protein